MAGTIALEVVTPDGQKLNEAVSELTAPSVDGEFGVLPEHRPLLAALATGIVTYIQDGQSHSVAVGPGFVEVAADRALLLTDRFIKQEDVDPVRVRLELKEVDEALDQFKGDVKSSEYAELVQRESWAAAQLELHGDPPPPRVRTVSELSFNAHDDFTTAADDGEPADAAEPAPADGGNAPAVVREPDKAP